MNCNWKHKMKMRNFWHTNVKKEKNFPCAISDLYCPSHPLSLSLSRYLCLCRLRTECEKRLQISMHGLWEIQFAQPLLNNFHNFHTKVEPQTFPLRFKYAWKSVLCLCIYGKYIYMYILYREKCMEEWVVILGYTFLGILLHKWHCNIFMINKKSSALWKYTSKFSPSSSPSLTPLTLWCKQNKCGKFCWHIDEILHFLFASF